MPTPSITAGSSLYPARTQINKFARYSADRFNEELRISIDLLDASHAVADWIFNQRDQNYAAALLNDLEAHLGYRLEMAFREVGYRHLFSKTGNAGRFHYELGCYGVEAAGGEKMQWVYGRNHPNCEYTVYNDRLYSTRICYRSNNDRWVPRHLIAEGSFICRACNFVYPIERRHPEPETNRNRHGHICVDCERQQAAQHAAIYNGELRGYHSTLRRWKLYGEELDPGAPPLGVELEMYMEGDRQVALRHFQKLIGQHGFFETDSSLDHEHGVEAIFHPMTLAYAQAFWPLVLAGLTAKDSKCKALAFNAPGGSYGIHISVGRDQLSPMQEVRMQMFMYAPENLRFVQAIAQRHKGYGSGKEWGRKLHLNADELRSLSHGARFDTKPDGTTVRKKFGSYGKYGAINMKPDLAEIRIFAATLKTSSFLKNMEFVDALCAWTSAAASTGFQYDHRQFLAWLTVNHLWKRYPNLLEYLRRYRFTIRGEPVVVNTWEDVLPPETKRQGQLVLVKSAEAA